MDDERYAVSTGRCLPSEVNCYEQRNKVYTSPKFDIVLHNAGYVGFNDQRNPTGLQLLECRAERLIDYLLMSPELLLGETEKWLAAVFQKMDGDLEQLVKAGECSPITFHADEMWRTRYNSLVVVVDREHERVHIAGSGQVHVLLLCKPRGMSLLTEAHYNAQAELRREQHYCPDKISTDVEFGAKTYRQHEDGSYEFVPFYIDEHTQLFYYRQAPLNPEVEYVMLTPEDHIIFKVWFKLGISYREVSLDELPRMYFDDLGLKEVLSEIVRQCPHRGRINMLAVLQVKLSNRKRRKGSSGSNKCLKPSLHEGSCSLFG